MKIIDIIEKKKNSEELSEEEIKYFIDGYTKNDITDYQAAALVMAICINGMTEKEIVYLTKAMAYSGDVLDFKDIADNTVDKHSTGGIGDKITLILSPIIASLGVSIAKMSGRGLGITGGTIDKLQSIPGYRTDITIEEFKNNVKEHGISLIGQSLNLVPADKKLYALRDSIGCTNSIPLIASSIMSKKIAAGAEHIILDVTCGSGAFMRNKKDAIIISKIMKKIGDNSGKDVMCILTNMNEPVGYSIGNSLEVVEAIKALKGEMADDVKEIILTFGAFILKMAGKGEDLIKNKDKIMEVIQNGKAYEKFKELVVAQNGDVSYIENPEKFEKAPIIIPVLSEETGYVSSLNAELIGKASVLLGAGREKKEDDIDKKVGIVLCKKVGDQLSKGDIIAYVHASNETKANETIQMIKSAYKYSKKPVRKTRVILEIL
ncbi:MAG: thymidine phosphorylase [Clostridia bacterium]|nr:thymidine phosphorylase [Clostridia bacterium]